jgi:hypothetical protein
MLEPFRVVLPVAVVLITLVVLVLRDRDVLRPPLERAIGLGALAVSAAALAFVAWQVLYPPAAFGEAHLAPGDAGADIDVGQGPAELIVHGQIGKDGKGTGSGRYALTAMIDGKKISFDGEMHHKVSTRKYMKRGVTQIANDHTESRHDLPADVAGKRVHVNVTQETGDLAGPLDVEIIPRPPRELPLIVAALVLSLVAGVVDLRAKVTKTYLGLGVGVLFAYAVLMLQSQRPVEFAHLARAIPIGFLLGAMAGGAMRTVARVFVRAT